MIFFNVEEARNQLLERNFVYTLRSGFRVIGRTMAVTGKYPGTPLCAVFVEFIKEIDKSGDLAPFLPYSGFPTVDIWLSKASKSARTLYVVTKT